MITHVTTEKEKKECDFHLCYQAPKVAVQRFPCMELSMDPRVCQDAERQGLKNSPIKYFHLDSWKYDV